MALATISATIVALIGLYAGAGNKFFANDACQRLERILNENLVGQEIAKKQIIDLICEHLSRDKPDKPLVISAHGPPGVGKTYTHYLIAKALYGLDGRDKTIQQSMVKTFENSRNIAGKYIPGVRRVNEMVEMMISSPIECPGRGCAGYKILYGMNYLNENKENQMESLRDSITKHFNKYRDSVIVIEEADKFNCEARAFLRQFLNHPHLLAKVSSTRPIIFLESNLGVSNIEGMFELQDDNSNVNTSNDLSEFFHETLRKVIFGFWSNSKCEDISDTLKIINHIDLFIPYFTLKKSHVRQLVELALQNKEKAEKYIQLIWDQDVTNFLIDCLSFDNGSLVNGARDVETIIYRHIGAALREFHTDHGYQKRKVKLYIANGQVKALIQDAHQFS